MARVARWPVLAGIALGMLVSTGTARAGDDDDALRDLLADCGGSGISPSDIDSCIERAREIDETSPSPQLQSLLAELERQAEEADTDASSPGTAANDATAAGSAPAPVKAASSQDDPPAEPVRAPRN